MPGFAKRYFNDMMSEKTPSTLEAYAKDLVIFFRYLDAIGMDSMSMTLKDLNHINSSVIEDFYPYILQEWTAPTRCASLRAEYYLLSLSVSYSYYSFKNPAKILNSICSKNINIR